MIPQYRVSTAAGRKLLKVAGTILVMLTILVVLPKDSDYAATSRLLMAIAFAVISIGGVWLIARAWRAFASARLSLRYARAPQPIALTIRFLTDERRLAWRFMRPVLLILLTLAFLDVLTVWPQLRPASLWLDLLSVGLLAAGFALVAIPLLQRTHWINALHLRILLAQQAEHCNFKPITPRMARAALAALGGPAVHTKGDEVYAGGFGWRWDDFLKSVLVLGQPGGGKTTTVFNAFLEWHFVRFVGPGAFGALLLDIMGDYQGKIARLCDRYGRSSDLFVLDLEGDPMRAGQPDCAIINPLDNAHPPAEIAAAIVACFEHVGMRTPDSYFQDAARTALTHGITLIREAASFGAVPSIADLHWLLTELHQAIDQGAADPASEGYKPTRYDSVLEAIAARYPRNTDVPVPVLDAINYINSEFKPMPDRQRAGVIGSISQVLAELLAEPIKHFVNGRSTISPQRIVDEGKILCVHATLAANPRGARIVNTLIKRQFQNAVLRRRGKAIPSVFFCDEFHSLFSPGPTGDSQFFSMSRQCNHANFIACQNIELLNQAAKSKSDVAALIGNAATKIMLRNTDPETNEMASRLFGDEIGISVTQSAAADISGLFRRTRTNYSRAITKNRVVPPEAFTRLAVPVTGDPDRQYAESIIHLATRAETRRLTLLWKVHPL